MARKHGESASQQAVIRWFKLAARGLRCPDYRLLYAIPNGGARTLIQGAILKGEGLRAGMPDLCLAMPVPVNGGGPRHGLYIEMKTWLGRVTVEQNEMLLALRLQGYECVVCRGFDQATRAITQYLSGKEVSL